MAAARTSPLRGTGDRPSHDNKRFSRIALLLLL